MVGRRGTVHKYEYFLLREPTPLQTEEERRERYNARARARIARKAKPKPDYKPPVKEHKPRPKPGDNIRKSMQRTFRKVGDQAVAVNKDMKHEPSRARVPAQTVEEFLAAGGIIDVL